MRRRRLAQVRAADVIDKVLVDDFVDLLSWEARPRCDRVSQLDQLPTSASQCRRAALREEFARHAILPNKANPPSWPNGATPLFWANRVSCGGCPRRPRPSPLGSGREPRLTLRVPGYSAAWRAGPAVAMACR